jgi:hypothetical protein
MALAWIERLKCVIENRGEDDNRSIKDEKEVFMCE